MPKKQVSPFLFNYRHFNSMIPIQSQLQCSMSYQLCQKQSVSQPDTQEVDAAVLEWGASGVEDDFVGIQCKNKTKERARRKRTKRKTGK